MGKASSTLYVDVCSDHVEMSRKAKLAHWSQVYTAYGFCRERCPAALEHLSGRLAKDPQIIASQQFEEGLSQGSGLESVENLRQLDEIMAGTEFCAEALRHAGVAVNSMEAQATRVAV